MMKYRIFFGAAAALLTLTVRTFAADQSESGSAEQAQVVEVVRSMFAALAAEDTAKLHTAIAPDFYAFDAGQRFTGDALIDLIKKAHAAGKVYVWTVNEPQVHIDGSWAWLTYVNRGSIKDASGTKDVSWLESAILRKDKGNWHIQFFHSSRVVASMVTGQETSAKADDGKNVEETIRQLDKERIQAQISADAVALDRIYAQDFIGVGPSGTVRTKPEVLSDFTAGTLKFQSITTDEVQVRVYENTVVETGLSTMIGQDKGKTVPRDTRFTRVWIKQQGRWQLVANHYSLRLK